LKRRWPTSIASAIALIMTIRHTAANAAACPLSSRRIPRAPSFTKRSCRAAHPAADFAIRLLLWRRIFPAAREVLSLFRPIASTLFESALKRSQSCRSSKVQFNLAECNELGLCSAGLDRCVAAKVAYRACRPPEYASFVVIPAAAASRRLSNKSERSGSAGENEGSSLNNSARYNPNGLTWNRTVPLIDENLAPAPDCAAFDLSHRYSCSVPRRGGTREQANLGQWVS
jgi:hypothetical protein